MFTLGYAFAPWTEAKAIADGPAILDYIRRTAAEYGVDKQISYGARVVAASWRADLGQWIVEIERGGERLQWACRFLMMCSGYYRYDRGHAPAIPGLDSFAGRVAHPQFWPRDLDYAGKRVLVIGSGATAVTLVPAMAKTADVTMLQRSPTYIVARPAEDALANRLRAWAPARLAYALTRTRNIALSMLFYAQFRKYPDEAKQRLLAMAGAELGPATDLADFTPRYAPWDQRLCLAPDGDFFRAVRDGRARVVTGEIETVTPTGVRIRSGRELGADIIVVATGLELLLFGGVAFEVEGRAIDFAARHVYKGCMFEGAPNLASVFGYTNSSWTLKADLIAGYVCRLLNFMRRRGFAVAAPPAATGEPALPFMDLTSGYVRRALDRLPQQGARPPWRIHQNYLKDVAMLRFERIEDGVLEFSAAGRS
jgi:cation diffusion facilitator CzcD-associated flavoprotein CzcO